MTMAEKKEQATSSVVRLTWIDGMRFVATNSIGHSIVMDAAKQVGGKDSGFSPVQLLLVALGGTGLDIVEIMRKQSSVGAMLKAKAKVTSDYIIE